MQDGRRKACQDDPDSRAANRERHLSEEPVARRQPRSPLSQAGAQVTECTGTATPERSCETSLTVKPEC